MASEVVTLRSEQLVALMTASLSAGFMAGSAGAEGGDYTRLPDDKTLAELKEHAIKIVEI